MAVVAEDENGGEEVGDEVNSQDEYGDDNNREEEMDIFDSGGELETGLDDEDDEFPLSVFGAEEKKRLEQQREKRRISLQMEKESLRESRVIFFRLKEQMSAEQLRRIRMVMGRLIALAPPVADDRAKLAKAFVIWSEKLPLYLKCNELRQQFDERGIALEVLRDSYYRDVLSVKLHLEKIYKKTEMPLELKELCGSVPSMDFRKLIQRSHTEQASSQLRDNLMSTSLVDENAKKKWGLNPWEQGHAYQVYKRINPERLRTGGASLNLYAPCRHRLYIKYCRSCVGVMSIVSDWNKDVETALGAKMTKDTNDELKKVVQNLNNVILEMTKKMNAQAEAIAEYEKGSKWWTEWAKKQNISSDADIKIKELRAKYHLWEETARMAKEDQATMLQNFNLHKLDAEYRQKQLQQELEAVTLASEETGTELNNEINSLKQNIKDREQKEKDQIEEIEQLKWERQKLTDENHRLKRLNAQLNSSLDDKDRQMVQYREDTENRIENLMTQVTALNKDLENQELENDRIADLLEAEKLENKKKQAAFDALTAEVSKLQAVIAKKDEAIAKLEAIASADSDDESDGITEEILEEYKDALQFIPKAMRKEIAKNLEQFGFDDPNGNFDEDMLDSVLDGEGSGVSLTNRRESQLVNDEDDFNFQSIPRRISEVPTNAAILERKNTAIKSTLPILEEEKQKHQPSQRDLLLAKYANVVSVPTKAVKPPSVIVPSETTLPTAALTTSAPGHVQNQITDNAPVSKLHPKPMVKQMSLSEINTKARAASFHKSSSLQPHPNPVHRATTRLSMVKGNRREMSIIQIFTPEQIEAMKEEGIRKAKLKKNILTLIPMLTPFMNPDRKLTLKVVATAVRFLVRFKNAIDKPNFTMMGALGRREEIKRAHLIYEPYSSIIEHLEKKVKTLEFNEAKYKPQIATMADTIKKLREVNAEYARKASLYEGNVETIQRDLARQHIIGQCQRNFAAELSETLGVIRNRIYMMIKYEGDIPVPLREEDAKNLEEKSMNLKEMTEEEEEAEKLRLQQRVNYLFRKLRSHVLDVSNFVQENKKIRPISTFALGRFPDFYSFSSKFRNELRNLQLFKKRALSDLSIVEKRWVVKTLKVCTSETNYRDLYFARLCPSCLDKCEKGLDGQWIFKKNRINNRDRLKGEGGVSHSPKEIKALSDIVKRKATEEVTAKFQAQLEEMRREAILLQEKIDMLTNNVSQLEGVVVKKETEAEGLREEVAESKTKYDICKREVFVLRHAIQDSYRAIEENALQQQVDRESKWRGKSTQIACSVCAIRYEKKEHGHDGNLTDHVDATDRILYPRATQYYHRVQRIEEKDDIKKKKIAFECAPQRDVDEPVTIIAKYRSTQQTSPKKDKSGHRKSKKGIPKNSVAELAIGNPPTSSSKFSQMKNIPANTNTKATPGYNSAPSIDVNVPMTKVQVSKVASLLQSDTRIAHFKKLQSNDLLNMTPTEAMQMYKIMNSSSKNSWDKKELGKKERPISAPSHSHNR